jgi:hypothetical protein
MPVSCPRYEIHAVPVYSHDIWIWPWIIAWRDVSLPGMLVRSCTSAPADCMRIAAILPRISCSWKLFDPMPIFSPSSPFTDVSGPCSAPVGTKPPLVPRPQPDRTRRSADAAATSRFIRVLSVG